jgi:hypothetical protein
VLGFRERTTPAISAHMTTITRIPARPVRRKWQQLPHVSDTRKGKGEGIEVGRLCGKGVGLAVDSGPRHGSFSFFFSFSILFLFFSELKYSQIRFDFRS